MSDIDWKDFQIGGKEGIFSIKSSISEIDKKNLNDEVGEIPYVTRTDLNNGISMYVTKNQDKKYVTNKGNVISIGLDTQTIFYQPTEFYTGQNIQILSHEKMNEDIARYLIPLLKIQLSKFSWGGNGATLKRLNNSRVMLPINEKDEPNWEYMEERGKTLYDRKHNDILKYLKKKQIALKTQLSKTNEQIFEEKTWKPFEVNKIFDVKRVSGVPLNKYEEGTVPFISTSSQKNGIQGFVNSKNKNISPENSLTISPIDGTIFFHPYKFIGRGGAGSSISTMTNENLNKYIGLFIKTMIEASSKHKASYGVQLNGKRLKSTKFYLPVTDDNEPDWNFMEYYMKQIEYKQISKIIKYLN